MKKLIYNMYRLIKFYFKLSKIRAFDTHSPLSLLLVIKEFVLSESNVYDSNMKIMYRTPIQNAQLLANLIDTYMKTKSKTTLEQIFEVLKMMIMKGK